MNEEIENKFDLLDVEPKFLEFFYDCIEDVDTFLENKKNNVIQKKSLKIKNICSKTQNIKIFESESRFLKIKGLKKKKLAPGTTEKILVEFSFYNFELKKYKNDKKKDILNIINNAECSVFLKIQSEYSTLNIPIYIKKKVALFVYDNIINLGICKNNFTYNFTLKIKNVGRKKGTFTISTDHSLSDKNKIKNKSIKVQFNDDLKENRKEEDDKEGKEKNNNLLIEFDKTSVDINANESQTINVKIQNKNEEKIHCEYKVLVEERSYFEKRPKNLVIMAIFVNSQTSFLFENIKTNQINLNYIYYGNKKSFTGKIKNENNYSIFCKYQLNKANIFYSIQNIQKYALDNNLDINQLKNDVFSHLDNELNEEEIKEKEKLFAIAKKNFKINENINIKLNEENGYFVKKLSYCEILFEIESKYNIQFLEKINRNTSYLLNFPVIIEITLYINRVDDKEEKKEKYRNNKEIIKEESKGDCNEEIKLFIIFCLTFPSLLSNHYFINYEKVSVNEGKTLIIELTNKNKFLKINYCFSKIPYITLNKREGVINPLSKDIISLKLKCETVKNIIEYIYVFFCNNLYFFVILINAEVKMGCLLSEESNLLKKKKSKSFNGKCIDIQISHKNKNDEIYEDIINNLALEKVDRNLYMVDGKLDKYKYNENFMNYLKNNKKKYNDILKYMYEKRKKKERIKNNNSKEEGENKEENILKNKINKIIKDINIYVNDTNITKISNTCIQQKIYEEKRKKYIELKNQTMKIRRNDNADETNLLNEDILEKNQLENIIFPKIIQFNHVLLNNDYTKYFYAYNNNNDCNIKIKFTHSDNINIDDDLVVMKKNSKKKINIKFDLKSLLKLKKYDQLPNDSFYNNPNNIFNENSSEIFNQNSTCALKEESNDIFREKSNNSFNLQQNDLFVQQIYKENIFLKINNNYVEKIMISANLVLLNAFIKINILYFYFENIDVEMFCENKLIVYNPFNIYINMSTKYNQQFFQIDNSILIPPNEYKIIPVKFFACKNTNSLEEYIHIYLDDIRLYKSIKCKCFINKCDYKVNLSQINFENVLLNKSYTKDFFLINTSDSTLVFKCVYKPNCINVFSKYNYVNKNEKIRITVSIKLKENKKIKDKIIFLIRGSEKLIIPINSKCTLSNIIFCNNLHIEQEKCELKNYEINILNKGLCEETIFLNLNELHFLNLKINNKKRKIFLTFNNKEYKNAHEKKEETILSKIHNLECEDLLIDECVKYFYNNFINLYNFICNKYKVGIQFSENENVFLNFYKINIPSKCFVSLHAQCYYNKALDRELNFNTLLHNKVLYENSSEKIKVKIKNSYLDISPSYLYFEDLLPSDSDESFITYFTKEKTKILKIKNVSDKNIEWKLYIYNEKQKENNFLENNIYKEDFNDKTLLIIKDEEKVEKETKLQMYEIDISKQWGILESNREEEIKIKLKNIIKKGRYVEMLNISIIVNEKNEININNETNEKKINYYIYILLNCMCPKLYFDVTYINIIHNKLNDYFIFPFHIYNNGYNYVRIDYHFDNLFSENFYLTLDFIEGKEINEKIKKVSVHLKCKSNKNLKFKSYITISVLDHYKYTIPLFINIDENFDYFLDKVEDKNELYLNEIHFFSDSDKSNHKKLQKNESSLNNLSDYENDNNDEINIKKKIVTSSIINNNNIYNDKDDYIYYESDLLSNNIIKKNNSLLSFYCNNINKIYENSKFCLYKELKINNIINVYYNEEKNLIDLNEIINDYVFLFLQKILLNKNYFPNIIENTNDLFIFFINLLSDIFLLNQNRNIQNLLNELKCYQNISMKDLEKIHYIHETFLKNIKNLMKNLKEEGLLIDHIIYENLLPVDLYLFHILFKLPDYFYIKKNKKEKKEKNEPINIDEIEYFLKNGNEKGKKRIFYFDKIFRTHLKLYTYSWITIFLEILDKKIFNSIDISSLNKLRGIKLCNIENKVNENIKIHKINYLIVLNNQNKEINKHTNLLKEKTKSNERENSKLIKVYSKNINNEKKVDNKSIKTNKYEQISSKKNVNDKFKYKKQINNDKNCCILNYFDFYENNFIDIKNVLNKMNDRNYYKVYNEKKNKNEKLLKDEKIKNFKNNKVIEGENSNFPKNETEKKEINGSLFQKEITKEQNNFTYSKNFEHILFEWLYFHYNNIKYIKVCDTKYIYKEDEVNENNNNNNLNFNMINTKIEEDIAIQSENDKNDVHHRLNKYNFYIKKKKKRKYRKKKRKIINIYDLRDLVIIIYTIISHIPYYLFFKNKIKKNCKSKKDYIYNIDILLLILNEIKLNNLINKKVLIEFNYIHIFLFLSSMYFILPNYIPKYYLIIDDISLYKNDINLINEEILRNKIKKKSIHNDTVNEKKVLNNQVKEDERMIRIYNLNNYKCKYNIFIIGCSKYEIDKNYIIVDSLKSEEVKLRINKNYDENIFKCNYNTKIKISKSKDRKESENHYNNTNFDDNNSFTTYSSDNYESSYDEYKDENEEEEEEGEKEEEEEEIDRNNDKNYFNKSENYTILMLREVNNYLPDEKNDDKYICIKLIEKNFKEKEESLFMNKNDLKEKNDYYNNLNDTNGSKTRNEINKICSNSSQLNIMLNNSKIKYFNFRGKVYENKNLEINLLNNTDRKVEINSNIYHLYLKDLKKEEKKKETFEIDINNISEKNHGLYNHCDVCSRINTNIINNLNQNENYFSCFYIDNSTYFIKENEEKKLYLYFSPFISGNYFCFLLFYVRDRKTKYLISTCKLNFLFYINNIKEEEVIKMNPELFNFSYNLKVCPINKEFLKCIKFILCNIKKNNNELFYTYLNSYLEDLNKNKNDFYIICDSDKVTIKENSISFDNFDYSKYMKEIHKLNIDNLYNKIKNDINCYCSLSIKEEINGVFEYNCILLKKKKNISNLLNYKEIKDSYLKEKDNNIYDNYYKLYKIIANVNNGNNLIAITFNTRAFFLSKKTVPLYNYTNNNIIYKCVYSEIVDKNNNKIDYKIFNSEEYIEINKDVEIFHFEVTCYSTISLICNCFLILTNIKNEEDQIKIKIEANISKPYPKETLSAKILSRMKKNIQIEIYNELDFHCEFKIYSDLSILFGDKTIEMLPKQKKVYNFFIESVHIGEFVGCLIFKFYKFIDKDKQNSIYFDYFFWYKIVISVELNEPLKIIFLETFVGNEINKEIVLKNNRNEKEEYFLLTYMNEYIEKRQIEIEKNEIYVYNINYKPKIPNYFENINPSRNSNLFSTDHINISSHDSTSDSSKDSSVVSFNEQRNENNLLNSTNYILKKKKKSKISQNIDMDIAKELYNFYYTSNEEDTLNNKSNDIKEEINLFENLQTNHKKKIDVIKNIKTKNDTHDDDINKNYVLKQKSKNYFQQNEKRIFEELINYCKKYINININYNNQNIGFFFIYNKNEGINYYILILLAKLRNELAICNFSACFSKSCLINIDFDFNSENKRFVSQLNKNNSTYSDNFFYKIVETVNKEDMEKNSCKSDFIYDHDTNNDIIRKLNNYEDNIDNNYPSNIDNETNTSLEVRCIYLSNKINYSIIDNKKKNRVIIKYNPSLKTSQECYFIIRNNLFGDFIYLMKGFYVVKRKIKEKIVMNNSCCLYHFNINLFNPFNCNIFIECKLKKKKKNDRKNILDKDTYNKNNFFNSRYIDEEKKKNKYDLAVKKEKVLLNNENNYFKILSNENFKIRNRKNFSLLIKFFCKDIRSNKTLIIILQPIHKNRNSKKPFSIIYEYILFLNNLSKHNTIKEICLLNDENFNSSNQNEKQKMKQDYFSNNALSYESIRYIETLNCNKDKCNKMNEIYKNEEDFIGYNLKETDTHINVVNEESKKNECSISESSFNNSSINESLISKNSINAFNIDESNNCESFENKLKKQYTYESELSEEESICDDELFNEKLIYYKENDNTIEETYNFLKNDKIMYHNEKNFIESLCKKKTYVKIYINKRKVNEREEYKILLNELENSKSKKKILHRNIEKNKCIYKIFLINLKNLNNNLERNTNIKINNIFFDIDEELLNDYLYIDIIEDTEYVLVISLELIAYLPFHCNFFIMIKKIKPENEEKENIEISINEKKEFTTIEKNYILVEIFNYINLSRKYLNVFIDNNLCSETKLNIFYKHTNDSYFDTYIINYNQASSNLLRDEIINYEIKPKSGILKHNNYNKFLIIRNNKNNIISFNNSFLLLIKTKKKIYSYIIFTHYSPINNICTTYEQSKIKEIMNKNKKTFSEVFNTFKQDKKESIIFNERDQIIIEDISMSTKEIKNF
ncbi:conserved Plasmodium protein, unknown function [Plasmodium relictum]|uniref:Uncharacterized protein n=1 Tax=Plasmodium relictum TaxID=85471 RepID=A0A1J1H349_PLARL|nr:conserved Plasmodium protein, unknown function [Plasmodium relictum]CRG98975.1 conserved Plasmodium protein, unknown function [Plasmodium relictum]